MLAVEDHKLIWKQIGKFKPGDWIVMKLPDTPHQSYVKLDRPKVRKAVPGGFKQRYLKTPAILDEDVAWLIGFIIGDGCIPSDSRPSIHVCVTDDIKNKLIKIVKDKFDVKVRTSKHVLTDLMEHGWIHSRAVHDFFRHVIGIKSGKEKFHVPNCILKSPQKVIKSFILGLSDADGYESYITTVHETLANDVADALLMSGVLPSIHKYTTSTSPESFHKKPHTHYRVRSLGDGHVPTERVLYKSSKSGKWYWRTYRHSGEQGVMYSSLLKSGLQHELFKSGYRYVQVKSVTSVGKQDVYDLHVPEQHDFVANGFIAHNCGGRESNMLRRIRTRSTASILEEVKHLYHTYGFTGLNWFDDELNVNKNVVELMRGVTKLAKFLDIEFKLRGFVKAELFTDEQAEAMYEAGFRWLLTGFESGSPRILENIQKQATREENTECVNIARRHGLKVKALMSIGHAGESEETIKDTKNWILENKVDDFDCTVISCYPGTPYYDYAVETKPGIWTFTAPKTGDKLHSIEVDYSTTSDNYKGIPGEYRSYVYTDYLQPEDLVRLRDDLENTVRAKLNIPFNAGAPGVKFESSMGQLPSSIFRVSQPKEVKQDNFKLAVL
jgi:hypothetical protein